MMNELMALVITLRKWKTDPTASQADLEKHYGVSAVVRPERSFTAIEINSLKAALMKMSVASYYNVFPEEITDGVRKRLPVLKHWIKNPSTDIETAEAMFGDDARFFPRSEHDVYMTKKFLAEHGKEEFARLFPGESPPV